MSLAARGAGQWAARRGAGRARDAAARGPGVARNAKGDDVSGDADGVVVITDDAGGGAAEADVAPE
eukprot:6345520-Karenia_brevis.AAC.1